MAQKSQENFPPLYQNLSLLQIEDQNYLEGQIFIVGLVVVILEGLQWHPFVFPQHGLPACLVTHSFSSSLVTTVYLIHDCLRFLSIKSFTPL